jgi:hypothetical protein
MFPMYSMKVYITYSNPASTNLMVVTPVESIGTQKPTAQTGKGPSSELSSLSVPSSAH